VGRLNAISPPECCSGRPRSRAAFGFGSPRLRPTGRSTSPRRPASRRSLPMGRALVGRGSRLCVATTPAIAADGTLLRRRQ
jgi:hypothetical protein